MPCCGLLGTQRRVRDSRKTQGGSGEDPASRVADGIREASRSRQEKVDRAWGQTVGKPLAPGMQALLVQGCGPSGEQGWGGGACRAGGEKGQGRETGWAQASVTVTLLCSEPTGASLREGRRGAGPSSAIPQAGPGALPRPASSSHVQGRKEQKGAPGGSALRGCWHLPRSQGCGRCPANRAAQGQRQAGLHGPGHQFGSWSPRGGAGPAGSHPRKEQLCRGSPVVRG